VLAISAVPKPSAFCDSWACQRTALTSGHFRRIGGRLVQRPLDRVSPYLPQWDTSACSESQPRLLDATEKFWVMFEPILEPIFLRRESDENASRPAVPRDHNLFIDGEP